MKTVYIDTSAFFKVFVEEEASEVTERIVTLAKEEKINIVLSNWVINESIALVDENRRKGRIDKIKTQEILSEIVDMIEGQIQYSHFTFFAVNEEIVDYSRMTIMDFHIPASDALHVYIALKTKCDYIISADKEMVANVIKNSSDIQAFNIRLKDDVAKLFTLLV